MKHHWIFLVVLLTGTLLLPGAIPTTEVRVASPLAHPTSLPAPGVWKADAAHSEVLFSIVHLGLSRVTGRFHDFDVTLRTDQESLDGAQVAFTAQVKSIDTAHPLRDKNLREQSYFFEADTYPLLSFTKGTLARQDDEHYTLKGNFTMKGITHPMTMNVVYHGQQQNEEGVSHIGFTLTGQLSRRAFGMDQTPVIEGTPFLSDSVDLTVHLDLMPQADFQKAQAATEPSEEGTPDIIKIVNMANKFSDAVNRADAEMFASLWAQEGRWIIEPPMDQQFAGRETMLEALPKMLSLWDFFVQQSPNGLVNIQGDTAYARFYVNETGRSKAGKGHYNLGLYEDKLIREEGQWKFWERHYYYLYLDEREQPGQAFSVPELPESYARP